MIYVTENPHDNVYELRFPYDYEFIQLVKNVAGRRYDPSAKMWTIPRDRLGFLLNQIKGTPYEEEVQIQTSEDLSSNPSMDISAPIPEFDVSNIRQYVQEGYHLFNHQIDFMKYAVHRHTNGYAEGFILADPPGTGKTAEILQLGMYHKEHHSAKHCLVICCVNSAKYNWLEDIHKHTNGLEEAYIVGTRVKRDGTHRFDTGGKEKLEDLTSMHKYGKEESEPLPYFIILNIEAIRYKIGKQYPIADRIVSMMQAGEISLVALDEIHRNASASSVSGKLLIKIKERVPNSVTWIPMSGTPINNSPLDLFVPLFLIGAHKNKNFYMWSRHFCEYGGFGGYDVIGYKNMKELNQMLAPNMLRRKKEDVLDLPPKMRIDEYVELSKYQRSLYDKLKNSTRSQISADHAASFDVLSSILKLRQIVGSPELVDEDLHIDDKKYLDKNTKLARLLSLVDEIIDNGEKVIVFSNWVQPLRTLYNFISKKHKVCVYTGTMKAHDRELHKKAFIEDPDRKVMLGTVGALGTSHTLTVANHVIFYDKPWNPNEVEQCEDRCHRPGTNRTVYVHSLIAVDTIEEHVEKILSSKEGISKYVIDNELDLRRHPELAQLILS